MHWPVITICSANKTVLLPQANQLRNCQTVRRILRIRLNILIILNGTAGRDSRRALVAHGVDDVIDAEADGAGTVLQWLLAVIQIFPVVAEVVVVIRDQLNLSVFIRHSPELWNEFTVGRSHLQRIDIVKAVKDGMA